MKMFFKILLGCGLWIVSFQSHSQVSVNGSLFSSAYVSESEICRVSLMNSGAPVMVIIRAHITNSDLINVIAVETQPFLLESGFVNVNPQDLSFSEAVYGLDEQSKYIQTTQKLPFGLFEYCVEVIVQVDGVGGDDLCEEINSDNNGFLFLVSPEDESIIETPFPVLIWMHSEPFSILTSQEEFRLVLVELIDGESAQSGITTNPPLFYVNNVLTHNVEYPMDAPDLIPGKSYGWQVQRVMQDIIVERTDAWEFSMKKLFKEDAILYGSLKRSLDSGYYPAKNNRVYFKFDEKYNSNQITCKVSSVSKEDELVNTENKEYDDALNYKINGYNAFELDLEPYKLKPGFYVLEVRNEKNDLFKLKFLIE